jgi:hypothetical protein
MRSFFMKALILFLVIAGTTAGQWPEPKSLAVPEADGYVRIPNAAFSPARANTYRAIFDDTQP